MCVVMIEKGASKTSGWSIYIYFICDSWGIYSPPLTSKHLNVEPIGGKTNAAFLSSMALMWWLPWTLPLRRLINLALVINILQYRSVLVTHYFKKWPNTIDQTCIVSPQLSSGNMTLKSSSIQRWCSSTRVNNVSHSPLASCSCSCSISANSDCS